MCGHPVTQSGALIYTTAGYLTVSMMAAGILEKQRIG
jgi:hypothetical protein